LHTGIGIDLWLTPTLAFAVDGSTLPNITWDVGESYAGLLPITQEKNETRKLFFWFFPSYDPNPRDEIVVWRK
jgi:carboxypeptidase D